MLAQQHPLIYCWVLYRVLIRTNEASVCGSCATVLICQRTSIVPWRWSFDEFFKMLHQFHGEARFHVFLVFNPTHKHHMEHTRQRQKLMFFLSYGDNVCIIMDYKGNILVYGICATVSKLSGNRSGGGPARASHDDMIDTCQGSVINILPAKITGLLPLALCIKYRHDHQ